MDPRKLSSQIDGTSALKPDFDPEYFTTSENPPSDQAIQNRSPHASFAMPPEEESFFSEDLRVAFRASGLSDIIPGVKRGSIAGAPSSISLGGIVAATLFALAIALLVFL